jgi:hypothetical protein
MFLVARIGTGAVGHRPLRRGHVVVAGGGVLTAAAEGMRAVSVVARSLGMAIRVGAPGVGMMRATAGEAVPEHGGRRNDCDKRAYHRSIPDCSAPGPLSRIPIGSAVHLTKAEQAANGA